LACKMWSTGFSRSVLRRSFERPAKAGAPFPERNHMLSEFKNEPLVDFTKAESKSAMEAALQKVRDEFGRQYPIVIGGERITGLKTFDSINPAHKDQLLGKFQKGTRAHVEQAVDAAWKAFENWKRQPVDVRAGLLVRAATLMRERKHEFSATMTYEVGKTWPEADADTAEAIDFLEFYAREAYRYGGEQPITKIESEEVGNEITEGAGKLEKWQMWIKRVDAEMGGKDAIIVDRETANLDEAAAAAVASAFGFQGQKCSACSRLIVDAAIYDKFV